MVRKEEVLTWFKELESYKRIDAMCGLLNMCLPFELRFVGTYVEELGKRDFQELRGAELRANNPTELAQDVAAAAKDPRAPRKMALYVSLLRSCNSACAATLYAVLVGLERAGLLAGLRSGPDPLEELLLLYSMALHHPAFTFDQRAHFGDILERLEAEEARLRAQRQQPRPQPQPQPPQPPPPTPTPAPTATATQQQPGRRPPSPRSRPRVQQPPRHPHQRPAPDCASCAQKYEEGAGYYSPPPSQTYETDKMRPRYPEPGAPCGACPATGPHAPAPRGRIVYVKAPRGQAPPAVGSEMNEIGPGIGANPPAAGDPLASMMPEGALPPPAYAGLQYNLIEFSMPQQHWPEMVMSEAMPPEPASPCDSRPVSPNVQVPPPPIATGARATPRLAQDVQMPPPPHDPHHHHHHRLIPNFNSLNIHDIKHVDDERLQEMGMTSNAVAQLRSLEKMNGMRRPPRVNKPPATYCATQPRQQSSGSESGSSTDSHSPPETPAISAPASIAPGRPRQQSPPPVYFMHHYPRAVFTPQFASYRPNFPPFATNGEPPLYGTHYSAPYVPMMYAPKVSCWNCGSMGHAGSECKEPSIEEVTRAGGYQLDYSTAPPDINDK